MNTQASGHLAAKHGGTDSKQQAARPWLAQYPKDVPADIDTSAYGSLAQLLDDAFSRYAQRCAFSFMGRDFSYADIDRFSAQFAAYLQSLGLQKGERVAVMLPNIIQYPIVAAAVMRAGLVLVNVNPLYTVRELEHQLADSGAKVMVVLENFASTLQQCLPHTQLEHIVLTSVGDMMGMVKGAVINWVLRHRQKAVPAFALPQAVPFKRALRSGSRATLRTPLLTHDDLALLQYTGGTTGVSKGAMLTHGNVIANALQSEAWNRPAIADIAQTQQVTSVCALPLYHIFGFTVGMMMSMRNGGKAVLIPNPRDLDATLKELRRHQIHIFPAVNTLFNALVHHPAFDSVDWSHLRISGGGGTAVQQVVAKEWLARTGCAICEGYGLSEASPSVACNPVTSKEFTGTIGLPMSGTWLKCIDDDGQEVALGEPGEIAIKGPQLMAGYWKRPEETAAAMTADGYFRTGDIGVMNAHGYVKIVDRKKDMVLVSGFNVYPNEVEDVIAMMPGVRECAVVGVPDDKTGEAIKLVVVKKDEALTEQAVRTFAKEQLTGYKRPKHIVFRDELPKNTVGKILRRELRD
ncbi:long-chain-fatty-acid--CoA ligase [Lampropedia puyangensis]|uniref:Long-chain-fatty-acid--CoA ligase n=1 Tax=Lampropedia puyangensis TaxID=1330072 RepID=A0A4S8EXL4_9BURK|nr:long-chain-fatty-acid--CoA ligase [Lampropedia puyangensis]THT99030.1 long-chain-fatty-acid--CoA ligase [Lampropedia puyangensis]